MRTTRANEIGVSAVDVSGWASPTLFRLADGQTIELLPETPFRSRLALEIAWDV